MTYPIADKFTSLQSEGFWTGTQSTFIRFAGCPPPHCEGCDTDFTAKEHLTAEQIVEYVLQTGIPHVVLTGGEPLMHDLTPIVEPLFDSRQVDMIEIETSGKEALRLNTRRWHKIWITVSPKKVVNFQIDPSILYRARVLKFVVTEDFDPNNILKLPVAERLPVFLQPWDYGDPEKNKHILNKTLEILKLNPRWRLSAQLHKLIGLK